MRRIRWKENSFVPSWNSEDNKKESIKARKILTDFLADNPKGNGNEAYDYLVKRGVSEKIVVNTIMKHGHEHHAKEEVTGPADTNRANFGNPATKTFPKGFEEEKMVQKKFGVDFWKKYSGRETLHEVVKHFVKEHPNDEQPALREFALEVVGRGLIGKKLNEHNFTSKNRKLVEIVQTEINKFDAIKSKPEKLMPEKKELQKVTIFDVDRLGGNEFQDFMVKLLQANGFTDVSVTGQAGDQGGDLLAKKDGKQLIIQAKRFSIDRKVTNSAVQEVIGSIAMYNANKGIVVTNSFYTRSAKELARVNKIELWNRDTVTKFIENYNEE